MIDNGVPEDAPLWERSEGRRLFNLCLKHGATPGQVHTWLQKKLESIAQLEQQASDAGWEREFYQQQARDMNNEGWK